MNLNTIEPTTPLEYALLEQAKKLAYENDLLRFEQNIRPEISIDKEISANESIERYLLRPYAILSIDAVPYGQEIKVIGKPKSGNRHMEFGYFIHESDFRSKGFVVNRMAELYKHGIQHLAKMLS